MVGPTIKMNGAGFRTGFVLSLSLSEFIAFGKSIGAYGKYPAKQVEMLTAVWNQVHGKSGTYIVKEKPVENKAMMPKKVKVVKKK